MESISPGPTRSPLGAERRLVPGTSNLDPQAPCGLFFPRARSGCPLAACRAHVVCLRAPFPAVSAYPLFPMFCCVRSLRGPRAGCLPDRSMCFVPPLCFLFALCPSRPARKRGGPALAPPFLFPVDAQLWGSAAGRLDVLGVELPRLASRLFQGGASRTLGQVRGGFSLPARGAVPGPCRAWARGQALGGWFRVVPL